MRTARTSRQEVQRLIGGDALFVGGLLLVFTGLCHELGLVGLSIGLLLVAAGGWLSLLARHLTPAPEVRIFRAFRRQVCGNCEEIQMKKFLAVVVGIGLISIVGGCKSTAVAPAKPADTKAVTATKPAVTAPVAKPAVAPAPAVTK